MEMWGISFKNVTMTTNKKKWWFVHPYYDYYFSTFDCNSIIFFVFKFLTYFGCKKITFLKEVIETVNQTKNF